MDNWYDWDASDAPEWSLYREWFDEDEMDERFIGSGGFTDDELFVNFVNLNLQKIYIVYNVRLGFCGFCVYVYYK